jgi:glycine dehydrogenase subunit 1
VLPSTLNPEVKLTMSNYLNSMPKADIEMVFVDHCPKTGLMDLEDLKKKVDSDTTAVFIENPSYIGIFESQAEEIGKIAKAAGAEFIVYVDPISLGIVAPPAQYGATIACGDFHSLGMHMQAGGGQGGFIATQDGMKYVGEFKDLMYGLTDTTVEGEYGFGEILFDRTSYGSRDKANEFTGTSTGLWAVTAGVYLSLMGPKGMEEVGTTIMQNSQYAAKLISEIKGVELVFAAPFFKEFVVNFDKTGKSVAEINKALLEYKIFGGKDLSRELPEYGQSALFCVTEIHTKEDIEKLVYALNGIVK